MILIQWIEVSNLIFQNSIRKLSYTHETLSLILASRFMKHLREGIQMKMH